MTSKNVVVVSNRQSLKRGLKETVVFLCPCAKRSLAIGRRGKLNIKNEVYRTEFRRMKVVMNSRTELKVLNFSYQGVPQEGNNCLP